ncbi:MAG: D-alanyl-D-alanine carboxypeptidase/D-alanyl-D-alanine-endopeptidase [Chloroflexaceae bacterium]|nr:D-alanyl-D-alanine carboxypeptidase/D-alanyl-D-alanine-endopeptidase [Chloroflexaceae bacterium]
MKFNKSWRNSLAAIAATFLAGTPWATFPASAQVAYGNESIEIFVPPPESSSSKLCSWFIDPAIEAVIKRPVFNGARWGILVESLASREVIYHYNDDKFFIPASNVKLLTTAAALQRLNPDGVIRSTSVRNWIATTNLRSDNNYAETLFRFIGGAGATKKALTELGVNPSGFRQVDGSGLSRNNAATPRALVDILRAMHSAKNREVFLASLPVAGISGTLRNRMRQTPVQGAVQAKTGTLTGVRALSGYLEHPDYGTLVFSIMANQAGSSGQALVSGIDEVILRLNSMSSCQ